MTKQPGGCYKLMLCAPPFAVTCMHGIGACGTTSEGIKSISALSKVPPKQLD